uniref:DNA-binding protein n=1 Tax=Steinernema glaseri TaxID=37863 RepID=A0A1I8AU54_9BILA
MYGSIREVIKDPNAEKMSRSQVLKKAIDLIENNDDEMKQLENEVRQLEKEIADNKRKLDDEKAKLNAT